MEALQQQAALMEEAQAQQERWRLQLRQLRTQWEQEKQAERTRFVQDRQTLEQVLHVLDSLTTGYTMSVERLARTLQQQGLERIATVGEPFDPERMEVVEAVTDSDRPAGEVIEEVRPGYLWHGRVLRYAQVRVAR